MCKGTFTTFVEDKLLQSLSVEDKPTSWSCWGFKGGELVAVDCPVLLGRDVSPEDGSWQELQAAAWCPWGDRGVVAAPEPPACLGTAVGTRCGVSADLEAVNIYPSLWVRSKNFLSVTNKPPVL